jgi:hypothetical protein
VTDRTAPIVLGLEPRTFRDLVTRHQIRHTRIGRRVVARVEDVLAMLDRLASEDGAPDEMPGTATSSLSGVDGVLARIGRQRVSQ